MNYLSTSDMSKLLNIPQHTLMYHIERGHLPEAAGRLGGRRAFEETQVPEMLKKVAAMRAAGNLTSERRKKGE